MRTGTLRARVKGTGVYVPVGSAPTPAPRNDAGLVAEPPPSPHHGASVRGRMGGFRPTGSGPNAVVQVDQPEMIRRSRDHGRNNPQGRRAISLWGTHIVGTGMKPRWQTTNDYLRQAFHETFDAWVPFADADGVLDFYGQQYLGVTEMAEGGESFGRLRTRMLGDGLPVPLQVQLIPVEQVPLSYAMPNGTNTVTQGIERDALNRRVAFWMYRDHPGDPVPQRAFAASQLVRVPSADVVHLYNVARIGQLRGLPWLAAALTTLHDIGLWQGASLLRKQIVTMLVGFIKKAASPDMSPEDLAAAWGAVQQELGGLPGVSLEPGTLQALDVNESVEFTNWQETAGADEIFLRTGFRSVASACDLIYEELAQDWKDSNDRTYRANFNTFKRRARIWQYNLLGHQFTRPIVNRWVDLAVASGAIKVPKSVPDADLYRFKLVPERWEYLNPKQDIEALAREKDEGFASRAGLCAERGDDVEVIDAERAADQAREIDLKLTQVVRPFTNDEPQPPAGNQ